MPSISRQTYETVNASLQGRSAISRALYVTAAGRRVVIVRVFKKKTEKTPRREIDLAVFRAKSIY